MDDLTFTARRHSAGSGSHRGEPPDLETRFKTLVQSPLRAGILRVLSARPEESFDNEAIMQTFGRMRQDVDNCIRELVEFGVVVVFHGGLDNRSRAGRGCNDASGGMVG